jgi:hypothetical protein
MSLVKNEKCSFTYYKHKKGQHTIMHRCILIVKDEKEREREREKEKEIEIERKRER